MPGLLTNVCGVFDKEHLSVFWTSYVPDLCLQSNCMFLPHMFLHKFKKIKFDNSGIEWVLEFIIYILLSAFGMVLSYMFHICALSIFTFVIWAVVLFYQYSCKAPWWWSHKQPEYLIKHSVSVCICWLITYVLFLSNRGGDCDD